MMAILLFSLSSLLTTIQFNASLVAWVAQKRAWWRGLVALTASCLLIAVWALVGFLVFDFFGSQLSRSPVLWGTLFASVIVVMSVVMTWILGFQRKSTTGASRAENWMLQGLLRRAIFFGAIAIGIQLWTDAHVRGRLTSSATLSRLEVQELTYPLVATEDDAAPLYIKALDAMNADYRGEYARRFASHDSKKRPRLEDAPDQHDVPDFFSYYWHDVVVYSDWQVPNEPYEVDYLSARLRSLLDRNKAIRRFLIQAGEKKYCGQLISEGTWKYDDLPQSLMDFRYYLEIDAQSAIALNDPDHAIDDYFALYRLGSHLMNQSDHFLTLIGMVLCNDAERYALKMVRTLGDPPPKLLEMKWPSSISGLEMWRRNTIGHRAYWYSYLLQSYLDSDFRKGVVFTVKSDEYSPIPALLHYPFINVFFYDIAARDVRQNYERILSIPSEMKSRTIGARSRLQEFERVSSELPWIHELIVADTRNFRGALTFDIKSRNAYVALALYRYFSSSGEDGQPKKRFPESLQELVPIYLDFIPGDPFNHSLPLSYRRTGQGGVVYSIGPNEKDDGGICSDKEKKDDIGIDCLSSPRVTNPE